MDVTALKDGKGKKLRRKAARGIGRKTRGPGLWRPRQESFKEGVVSISCFGKLHKLRAENCLWDLVSHFSGMVGSEAVG